MKNRKYIVPLVALSFGLAACQADEAETSTPTEESSSENESSTDKVTSELVDDEELLTEEEPADPNYDLLEQAKDEYYSGELDAAAGTLSRLLQNDLSDNELLKAEAEDLKEEISQQQAENAKAAAEIQVASEFTEERQSTLLSEEFEEAKEQSLSEATDEELESFLTEKEVQKTEPLVDAEATETTEKIAMTKQEAENHAFEQVLDRAVVEGENYFYFVNYAQENWVQVEAREAVEQDGVTFSNLIGIYRYNVETDEIQKLDIITGEYNTLEEQ
ncbi:hypothetical protein [Alkalibacterium sp. 20]|uniref:hypothetical protein n=1 Tax=Alkalibacterium sp. 20 TaxID=1798803 RepID=UPI0009001D2D|nr:hypothetical protein [Alkalibacterium sp. 20]OJF92201.1 hypothetical protein AX762_03085 [Alkalibacterium sp. 20]